MLISGRKTVATAQKPERLVNSPLLAKRVEVQALTSNATANEVFIGGIETYAGAGGEMGISLVTDGTRGDRFVIDGPVDLYDIWLDVQTNGEGVSWLAET